jgi:hypothetical protein
MDAPGVREELKDMARRLGTIGFYVLLPNLYYRARRDTIFGPTVLEEGGAERERMRAIRTKMTIPPVMNDLRDVGPYRPAKRGKAAEGRLPRPLHERPLCLCGGRALSRRRCRSRFVLRYPACQRRRGKPPPLIREGQSGALYCLRRARRAGAPGDGRRAAHVAPAGGLAGRRSNSTRGSIAASRSRNAGATTNQPRSGIGSS